MQNLTEKVYECTLAVEAHMICDLLSQAGISARVDGEFLQSGGGELPLGNLVKVRVDPSSAVEAREVIADWEKLQPVDPISVPVTKASRFKSPLWFFFGILVGATLVFLHFYRVYGTRNDYDRNQDGHADARWTVDWQGYWDHYEEDNDFDGRFEWQFEVEGDGFFKRAVLDEDGDGRPERVTHYASGVAQSIDYFFASGGRIVKREHFKAGLLDSAECDDDGDGIFERRVRYDRFGEPVL